MLVNVDMLKRDDYMLLLAVEWLKWPLCRWHIIIIG